MACIFFVYPHLFRALFIYFNLFLKTLQHNTITHRESKALVPNTIPPSSLGPVSCHRPSCTSQPHKKGGHFLCKALSIWKSNSSTQDICTASTSPQASDFTATTSRVLFQNCPIPSSNFLTLYHVCTVKEILVSVTKKVV